MAYTNDFDLYQPGQHVDSGNKRAESYSNVDASALQFGRGVALDRSPNADKAVRNFYQEIATVTYDADFVTSNSIAFSVNGAAITPVVFDTDQATTKAALVAAIDALTGVSCVAGAGRVIVVTRRVLPAEDSADIAIETEVTLGGSQASASTVYSTDQVFGGICMLKQNEDGEIAQYEVNSYGTQGVFAGELVTGQDPAIGGSVYVVSTGANRGKFTTVDDATTEAVSGAVFKGYAVTINSKLLAPIEFNRP